MKTAGIIAEYNPFHNGHKYHIEETRRRTVADYVSVVMSGDFVQRGAPAVLDKYDRARMALLHGADLVFELPAAAALSSAEGFATGGVTLLAGLGVVDTISCGCESADADPQLFSRIVSLLAAEPEEYRRALSESLRDGNSYPAAREAAVRACLGRSGPKSGDESPQADSPAAQADSPAAQADSPTAQADCPTAQADCPAAQADSPTAQADSPAAKSDELGRLLSLPNNILALEYARALRKNGGTVSLCLIPRRGSAHHGEEFSGEYASASAIRSLLFGEIAAGGISSELGRVVPPDIRDFLLQAEKENRLLREDDFSDVLHYALTERLDRLGDFGPERSDLSNRTARLAEQFTDWTSFAGLLKTKNQTYTAVSRYLAQILLDIRRDDLALAAEYDFAPCARLLGFRKEASPVLKSIRSNASLPVLTRLAREYPALEESQRRLMSFDIQASAVYRQILQSRSGCKIKSEFRQPVLTI